MIAPDLAAQLRRLVGQADRATVPDRMLALLGAQRIPAGASPAPVLTQMQWQGVYLLLENAALDPGIVRPLGLVQAAARDIRPDDPMPIAIANFRIAVPKADFVARVKAAAQAGTELNPAPGHLADVIEVRRAFAASALLHDQWPDGPPTYRARQARFVIDPRFLLAAPGAPWPDLIEVDAGAGFVPQDVGIPFAAGDLGDAREVHVRCRYGGEELEAAFTFAISDRQIPKPDDTWPLQDPAATGPRPATGRAWVFHGIGHREVVNPVILVEGFPGGHPSDYLYELLDNSGMVHKLRFLGYDLVVVGLDDGMQPIEKNVGVLVDCIREARGRTRAPLVVGGVSMGGIISRIALAQLESNGEPHATRAYLSIDAPHGGSYTSLGVQWFVHALLAYMPGLRGYAALLDSPANQELMLEWLHDGGGGPSPLRAGLLKSLAAVGGYPRQPRKLAVACGQADGQPGSAAGATTLAWSAEPFASVTLRTLPGDPQHDVVGEGEYFLADPQGLPTLTRPGALPWETAPGSLNDYNAQAAAVAGAPGCGDVADDHPLTCGIPTVSALDLDQSPFAPVPAAGGPFDAFTCSDAPAKHLELTQGVSDWVVRELGAPPLSGAWNPYAFDPHEPGFLQNPYPTYASFRAQTPAEFYVALYKSHWFFGYAECEEILEQEVTFVKSPPGGPVPVAGPPGIMKVFPPGIFNSDPPRHTTLRSQIEPPFKAALANAPALAQTYVTSILGTLGPTGHMELINDFALPVPAFVLFDLLGIPQDQQLRQGLLLWEIPIVRANDPTTALKDRFAGATTAMALHHYLQGLVRLYRGVGGPGLIGTLAQAIGPTLTEEDVYSSCVDFVIAGYLSTTWLVASAITALIAHPDQMELLRANPQLVDAAMTEALRLEPPFQLIDRYATQETTLGGVDLKVGDKVTAVVGSANRDPATFEDPDDFRLDRPDAQLAFGAGIHYCIGAPLARIVAPAMLWGLLRLHDLEVAGIPQWGTDPFLRGMANLPLSFRPELVPAVAH
jgi:cytochrome P450